VVGVALALGVGVALGVGLAVADAAALVAGRCPDRRDPVLPGTAGRR
jgi:hypothetical protein